MTESYQLHCGEVQVGLEFIYNGQYSFAMIPVRFVR